MKNYSLNDIKEVIKSQCKVDSNLNLEEASKLVHKLVENRDKCFDSTNSEFKMGDLVYLTNYGEIGTIVGKLDVFEETARWEEEVKKSGSLKAAKLKGIKEPSPRYLIISLAAEDKKEIEALKQIFGNGEKSKYEPSIIKKGSEFDKNLRVRYSKENTLKPLLSNQEALVSTNIGMVKTDINNFCSYQCIFNENCSEDCVLHKHKKK